MPRNKYPEQTVEKILDAAAALFAEKGYQSTTLQDIIDATGLSKGAVYHHFRSKEENARRAAEALAKAGITAQPQKSERDGKPVWGVVAMGDAALLAKIKAAGFADAYFLR